MRRRTCLHEHRTRARGCRPPGAGRADQTPVGERAGHTSLVATRAATHSRKTRAPPMLLGK